MEEIDDMSRAKPLFAALAVLAVLVATAPAQAGMIPAAVSVTPVGPNFNYAYSVILPSDYQVKDGDFFTVYDFNGFASGSNSEPAGWTFGASMLGPNPPHISPSDDPGIANLTWTYHGPSITGPGVLGSFSANSSFGPQSMNADFASQDHRLIDGAAVGNFTTTSAPEAQGNGGGNDGGGADGGGGVSESPEPATLAIMGFGLPIVGLMFRLRRRAA
jgi:hypothetical protein